MSITIIKRALKTDLPAGQRMLLVALASFLNEKRPYDGCFPSIARLVKSVGASDRTIQAHLQVLEQASHITCVRRAGCLTTYYVHPVIPRQDFGGRRTSGRTRSELSTPESSSSNPRKKAGFTPEESSDNQERSKKEKGEEGTTRPAQRRKRADKLSKVLAESSIPAIRRANR